MKAGKIAFFGYFSLPPMPSVHIKTYGCQMNERDSEQVAKMLGERGYRMTPDETEADVILLNTCSVRDMAEQKAIGKMGMLHKLRKARPHLVLGYLGCMAQARGDSLTKTSPHVDLVVGTQKFHRVADYVDDLLRRRLEERIDDQRLPIVDVGEEEGSQATIREQELAAGQCTAFVSIMQGCNMHCAFCIVPQTRGAERARSIGEIVGEVRELADRGVREVTLLGQIVNLYGRHEFPKKGGLSPFVQLLEAVCGVGGIERVRFTSPHPIGFRTDLIAAFGRLSNLVEHVHLPLQSGSDRILKIMRRGYTADTFRKLLARLRTERPGIATTTDIIVGFPGETDEDYAATRALADEAGFDNAFVFRYSPRQNTPAATMEDQVPEDVKEWRNKDLLEVVNRHCARHLDSLVGQRVEILCEGASRNNPERLSGRTRTNKIVVFEGAPRHVGRIFDVRIERTSPSTLYGTLD
ncbi:MAG: tRNA (N6-isopentenyl adenosine(37)-C2)-methylthiotransferase MiaB [Terrimicrobiaceae bacterium]|nr:tRNA (N6-isopentenyl adenosine(37)-C2)-methylthiotransferase MiaB [Terrimicrobiaceae bacterium]